MSKCLYKNVLISAVFPCTYIDTDSKLSLSIRESIRNCDRVSIDCGVDIEEMKEAFRSGKTHCDIKSIQKVRINSIYGEVRSKA